MRPPYDERTFHSPFIDQLVGNWSTRMIDKDLGILFENCLPNTLDTTIVQHDGIRTFIKTGDIDAMWMRDGVDQLWPYVPYVKDDPDLSSLVLGMIKKQQELILLDPYANAFNLEPFASDHFLGDQSTRPTFLGTTVNAYTLSIFERKFEVDSPTAFVKLCNGYFDHSGGSISLFKTSEFLKTIETILDVLESQQTPEGAKKYFFLRSSTNPRNTILGGSFSGPFRYTGMVSTPFRVSDDTTTFPFNIAQNARVYVELRDLLTGIFSHLEQPKLFDRIKKLADDIKEGISTYGIVNHPKFGNIYAFEVNGYGSCEIMDDGAGVPSLLSLPYIGFCDIEDEIYQNTRKFILSMENPFFYKIKGREYGAVGSTHTGEGYLWPMAIIMRVFTTKDDKEILESLEVLKESAVGGFMHESFSASDFNEFTRPWFAWVNCLFGELILHLGNTKPHLIFGNSTNHRKK